MEVEGGHVHISQGLGVIHVSPKVFLWEGGGIRPLFEPGEIKGARSRTWRTGGRAMDSPTPLC